MLLQRFHSVRNPLLILCLALFGLSQAQQLEPVYTGLVTPVHAQVLPEAPQRFYIGDLNGHIRILEDGVLLERQFLNLAARVTGLQGEQGFYSFAFHPDFSRNGRLFATYTEKGTGGVVLAEFHAADAFQAAPEPVRELLRVPHADPFHHGGQVAFGPDGYLYASFGDGIHPAGSAERQRATTPSQDLGLLHGKLVRLDVDGAAPYAIPPDNPFTAEPGARAEIFALGLRNPWKFSFDRLTGELYLSDVGADRWEEINRIKPGGNYGWPYMEGRECFQYDDNWEYADPDCPGYTDGGPFELPIATYTHVNRDPLGGNSVTGGFVYRGSARPQWYGLYFFGDFVSGRIWTLDVTAPGAEAQLWLETGHALSGFVEDAAGELYVLTIAGEFLRLAE